METQTIAMASAGGISTLLSVNPLTTALVLVILGLCWLIRALLKELKEVHIKSTNALIANTSVISEMKEMIRAAIQTR